MTRHQCDEGAQWQMRAPDLTECCICDGLLPIMLLRAALEKAKPRAWAKLNDAMQYVARMGDGVWIENRPTGPRERRQDWPYCLPCWERHQKLCSGSVDWRSVHRASC